MKKLIQQFTFGKPVKGEPLNYNTGVRTVTPFNVNYEIWLRSIEDYGYSTFINWLIKIHK